MRNDMTNDDITDLNVKRMMDLLRVLSPFPRMINSPGLDKTFEIIKQVMPDSIIHEYPSGMECEDWVVPRSWSAKYGVMMDETGNTIASIEENHLFVVPYSESVEGWFTKEEIERHLYTRPDRPNAFSLEHRNAYDYQLVDWGITLPYNRWINLSQEKYYIKIVVDCKPGSMKVAEYFLEGRRPETICICAHIDELCNDNLSGCVVAVELARYLEHLQNLQYSYQLLLVPEMFGTLFYVYSNLEKIKKTVGMLNLEALGTGFEWCLKKAHKQNTRIEKVLRSAMEKEGISFKEVGFFEGYGNDERVYAWPSIGIPGVSLQRYPFEEYHTSDDTPSIINSQFLFEAFEIGKIFIQILEKDYVPQYTKKLQPWLTRNGLYFDCQKTPEDFQEFNNIVLFGVNGRSTIMELAKAAGLDFFHVYDYIEKFVQKGLVKKLDVEWS